MKSKLLLLFAFLSATTVQAQVTENQHATPKLKYHHDYLVGIAFGEAHNPVSGSLTTLQGIEFKQFAWCAGAGLEGYENWRTVPVFGSVTYYFSAAESGSLFIQANAGHAFASRTKDLEDREYTGEEGGLMLNAMCGYRFRRQGLNAYLAVGTKHQRLQQSYRQPTWGGFTDVTEKLTFERIVLQMGIGF